MDFPLDGRNLFGRPPAVWQGPSPLPQRCAGIRTGRGPKAPGQRPPRPRRALPARRVGRWPAFLSDLPVRLPPCRAGGGNAGRVSCSRPERRRHRQCLNGRGHRPCHSGHAATCQPGAKAPGQRPPRPWRALLARRVRPAPAPPLAGASPPPGRALAFRGAWTDRSTGNRAARAGETRLAFPDPAQRGVLRDARSLWPGPSPLP